jgi:beta-lactamase class A
MASKPLWTTEFSLKISRNREPTSGLEPLTPALYECAVSGCRALQRLANPAYTLGFLFPRLQGIESGLGSNMQFLQVLGPGLLLECALAMARRPRRPYDRTLRDRTRRHAGNPRRRQRRRRGWPLLIFGLLLCLFIGTYSLWDSGRSAKTTATAPVDGPTTTKPPQPPEPARAQAVDELHSKVLGISKSHAGTYGVVVFDPYSGETASLNAERRFVAASLSKLYALLTLYRAASQGEISLDNEITMRSSDVWAYGTGVLSKNPSKYPVGYTMTLRECAKFMIKESDNTAELMLNRYLEEERIEAELNRIGADSTRYWHPINTTTPNDILLVLKKIADPSYTSPQLSAEMLGLMTNTSFEDRLPRPLPEETRVAHKIGSYESTFSDAGMVFPTEGGGEGQEYYIIVFCEGAAQEEAIETIQDISLATYQAFSH